MEKRKIVIKGPRVHDVGYRALLLEEAEFSSILNFSARNIKNKTEIVEVLVGGDEEKVEAFVEFARNNFPADAKVTDVSVEAYEEDIRTIKDYSRAFSSSQLSKIATTGLTLLKTTQGMSEKQAEHIAITQGMSEKQAEHIAITKGMSEKQAEHIDITRGMSEKQAEHIDITKGMSEKQGTMLDKQDTMIDKQDELKGAVERGFTELKDEHIRTREMSMDIFHSEVEELRQEITSLRSSVEEIRKKVGIA